MCSRPRPGDRALAPGRVEHRLGRDALAALEHDQRAALVALDGLDRLAEAEDHAEVAQRELQRAHDLRVAERQQLAPRVDHGDLGADGGEHRGVLDADHAGADDDERLRDLGEVEDAVGVEDRLLVELDARGPHRPAAGRDHDAVGVHDLAAAVGVRDHDRVVVDEARVAVEDGHVVARELVADDVGLALADARRARAQVLHRDVGLDAVALAVDRALAEAGQVQHGLAQRLRGDRPAEDAAPAELLALDDRGAAAELRGLDRGLLARRPGADREEVEVRRGRIEGDGDGIHEGRSVADFARRVLVGVVNPPTPPTAV